MKKDSLSKASLSADHLTQSPSRESSERGDITPVVALNGILRNRHLLLGCAVVGAVVFATLAWFKPQSYTATAILMPQGAKAPTGGVAGLASQAGIGVGLRSPEVRFGRLYTFVDDHGSHSTVGRGP